ncbi:MAG: rhodanese-like domain-containing protein [Actinomycetes bacterium]
MPRIDSLAAGPDRIELLTFEISGLGNRSYLAIADGWAVAVDVQRDLDRVRRILDERGLRLAAVVETHVHNDYVTGGLALARHYGASYVVPPGPALRFDADRGHDGDSFRAGPLQLQVINSPGHTDAHASYSLHVGQSPAVAAFTGGSLLIGGTGRTDLLGVDRARSLAREQFRTADRIARRLPPEARLLPTHGFGSFCLAGKAVASPGDTLADQFRVNPAFLLNEEQFIDNLIAGLGPVPAYFPKMAPRNVAGPDEADLTPPPYLEVPEVARRAKHGDWVVDVRQRHTFGEQHVPGSISVDADGALATWVGWTVGVEDPIVVVADDDAQLAYAQRELVRIGIDRLAGAHVGQFGAASANDTVASARMATFDDLADGLRAGRVSQVIDVRNWAEWRTGHVAGAIHLPAYEFTADRLARGDLGPEPWLYCGVGFRAAIAASLMERAGQSAVVVDDSIVVAEHELDWCTAEYCTTDRCHADQLVRASADGR